MICTASRGSENLAQGFGANNLSRICESQKTDTLTNWATVPCHAVNTTVQQDTFLLLIAAAAIQCVKGLTFSFNAVVLYVYDCYCFVAHTSVVTTSTPVPV